MMKQVVRVIVALFAFDLSASARADQVINADLIVTGTLLCVGDACVDGEPVLPGYNGIKIKALDTALLFEDVSTLANFAGTDWQLSANTPGIGGLDAFLIDDRTNSTIPLHISAGAPTNSLHVAGDGRIGLGTSLPQQRLHLTGQFEAAMRLEQTQGTPYAWDLRGNSNAFSIFDVTAGRAPFIIFPGAPPGSLNILTNGNVGVGEEDPMVPLHVRRNTGFATDMMRLENNGGVVFRLKDTSPGGQEFTFQSNGGIFRIASPAVPGPEFTMDDFGNVVITGQITTAGSCSAGCDRVFSEEYDLPRMEDHHAAMWAQGHLPNVGPTPEDGPFNLTEKVGGMLNELEHAHIYIGQLHERIEAQEKLHAELLARLEELEATQ